MPNAVDERADAVQCRAVLHAGDADVARDLRGAAEVLDVVVGHRGAFGMTDDVDLVGAGRVEHPVDERGELAALCSIGASPPN